MGILQVLRLEFQIHDFGNLELSPMNTLLENKRIGGKPYLKYSFAGYNLYGHKLHFTTRFLTLYPSIIPPQMKVLKTVFSLYMCSVTFDCQLGLLFSTSLLTCDFLTIKYHPLFITISHIVEITITVFIKGATLWQKCATIIRRYENLK